MTREGSRYTQVQSMHGEIAVRCSLHSLLGSRYGIIVEFMQAIL